jgi:hypothetical protein
LAVLTQEADQPCDGPGRGKPLGAGLV